jgi:hypothetical protein
MVGPVHPVQLGQRRVRKLEPQVNEGRDDPVSKRQVAVRAGARSPDALVTPAFAQPVFLGSQPGAGQLADELAQRSAADPGEDTMRQGRAGPS